MSSTSRRFGTDVSNIPSAVLHKTSKKNINKPHYHTPKSNSAKPTPRIQEAKSSPLFDVMETLMDTFKISIDDEITVTSPVKLSISVSDEFRYERDFLLKFQKFYMEPIEDLISEVKPGFIHPDASIDQSSSISSSQSQYSSHKVNSVNCRSDASLEASRSTFGSAIGSAVTAPKQWRAKHIKPREQDSRRLAARQKQIDIGMNTVGFQKYSEIPSSARTKAHPKIPDIHQVCSKRSWDGQVRKWRRQLHDFDPSTPEAAGQHLDGLAQNAAGSAISNPSSDDECSDDEESEVLVH